MNLKPLFEPKTMAVIGVSLHNDQNPANVIYYKNLLRYPVDTYAVNPKAGILKGQRAYSSVLDIPADLDTVVIAARAEYVPGIMEQCAEKGVKSATIISGGFAEVGNRELQDRVISIAREADIPVIGPNCLGIFSPGYVDTFFFATERMGSPERGNVALISQSGGVLVDQMIRFQGEGVGMSLGASIGNKAYIKEADLIRYLDQDPNTKVISFYIEGFGTDEGADFMQAAKECSKPVVVLKAGKSAKGGAAVASHTASLAGDYKVFSSVLKQHGVVEAANLTELLYFSEALSSYPENMGPNVGIITGSGGHGALSTDLCSDYGLNVPNVSEAGQAQIRSQLSPSIKDIATCTNPVDLTGSSADDDFVGAALELGNQEEIDALLMLLLPYFPGIGPDLGGMLSRVQRTVDKPMVAYIPRLERYGMLIEGFELNNVPVAHTIEGAVHMLQGLTKFKKGGKD